ncbi:MAG: sulfite oxidase-like oxidoreductase [bacterium]
MAMDDTTTRALPVIVARDTGRTNRVPPGQYTTVKWPVLDLNGPPRFDPNTWRFRVFGLVDKEIKLTYDGFKSLPRVLLKSDFHCVTRWSKLDNTWEGVQTGEIAKVAGVKPNATHVILYCHGPYTTNLPLDEFLPDENVFAWKHDGQDLEPDHGYPLRLVVPSLYAWKSAKWVEGVEFISRDRPGYWEVRGYHNHADPWTEERFGF